MNEHLTDLKILLDAARDDHTNQRYESYPEYIAEFNRLLPVFEAQTGPSGIEAIDVLRDGQVSMMGAGFGTTSEKAKLREIVNKCDRLMARQETDGPNPVDAIEHVNQICTRFHTTARQLQNRHAGRDTIELNDEYDVQDLFHGLLKLFFDDVRAEEWTPSYAGGASRVDFLLKNEQIIVEIKKTRQGLADRQIGEQLIIDIERYQAHPDCNTLICFVYDPEGRIGNPRGVESDLMRPDRTGLSVVVYIRPKQE